MEQAVLAMALWLLGFGTTGEANSHWQEKVDRHLPAVCEMWEDGSGRCDIDGQATLRFPAWPENNGEQGFELPYWEQSVPTIPQHYTR